jgi:peptidoglycan-associated lipoprotein
MTEELLERSMTRQLDEVFTDQLAGKLEAGSTLTEAQVRELLARLARGEITEEEFRRILSENTTLTEEELTALIASVAKVAKETEELKELVASATDAKELEQILRERSNLTEEEIAQLSEQKQEVLAQEADLKADALEKIVARLKRNKELGIDLAFCAQTASIDQFFIAPSFFALDEFTLDKENFSKLSFDVELAGKPFRQHKGIVLQIEGNADDRGSNQYNKALGDRRWFTPARVLTTLNFRKEEIRGVSRGEECPLSRETNDSDDGWWSKNRRDDYVVKLE